MEPFVPLALGVTNHTSFENIKENFHDSPLWQDKLNVKVKVQQVEVQYFVAT